MSSNPQHDYESTLCARLWSDTRNLIKACANSVHVYSDYSDGFKISKPNTVNHTDELKPTARL